MKTHRQKLPMDAHKWLESAATTEDNRPALTFIHQIDLDGEAWLAADGYRLHLAWEHVSDESPILHSKYKGEQERSDFSHWLIGASELARVNYNRNDLTITVLRSDLERAVKLAMTFARDSANSVKLSFDQERNALWVWGASAEHGEVNTAINASYAPPIPNEFRCLNANGKYLIDAVRGLEGEQVTLRLRDSKSPLVVGEWGKRVALVMPMTAHWDNEHARTQIPAYDVSPYIPEAGKSAFSQPIKWTGKNPYPKSRKAKREAPVITEVERGASVWAETAFYPENLPRNEPTRFACGGWYNEQLSYYRIVKAHAKPPTLPDLDTLQPDTLTLTGEPIPSRDVLCNATVIGWWPGRVLAVKGQDYYLCDLKAHVAQAVDVGSIA